MPNYIWTDAQGITHYQTGGVAPIAATVASPPNSQNVSVSVEINPVKCSSVTDAEMEAAKTSILLQAPTIAQLLSFLSGTQNTVLATGITVNVAAPGEPAVNLLCDGTAKTLATLGLYLSWGQANPTTERVWLDNNNVSTTVIGSQLVTLANAIIVWNGNTYATAATNTDAINAGTITTYAQIKAIVWPTS